MAKLALLIGVSDYEKGFKSLFTPIKNVEAIAQVLQDQERGDFDDIKKLINPNPLEM